MCVEKSLLLGRKVILRLLVGSGRMSKKDQDERGKGGVVRLFNPREGVTVNC